MAIQAIFEIARHLHGPQLRRRLMPHVQQDPQQHIEPTDLIEDGIERHAWAVAVGQNGCSAGRSSNVTATLVTGALPR